MRQRWAVDVPSRATTPTWAGRSATGRLDAHQGHSDAWIFPRKVRSLPAGFAYRDLIVTMTVGVVLLSLLVQGITMAPLLRRPGLLAATEPGVGRRARALQIAAAGLAALAEMGRSLAAASELLR